MREEKVYPENGAEMNIMDLFWSVLHHWRGYLVAVLVVGMVMACFGAWKEYQKMTNRAFIKESQEAYENALDNYRLEKEQLEKQLHNLKTDLDRQRFFEENSVMLFIDQYNVFTKRASYYVDTNYEIAPQMYFQNPNYTAVITRSYKAALDRMDLDTVIATAQQPEITTSNPIEGNSTVIVSTTVDDMNGVLSIVVRCDTQERMDKIFEAVKETLASQETLLNQVIGEHTLETLYEVSRVEIDTDFGDLQAAFKEKVGSITDGIEETGNELSQLREPVNATPTKSTVIKKGVILGVAGAIIVTILLTFYYIVRILLQDKLNSTEDIIRRYRIPVLGVMAKNTEKWKKLDKIVAEKLGFNTDRSTGDAAAYIASNIRFYLKDRRKLLLVGNCDEDKLHALKDELTPLLQGVEIQVGGDVNKSAAAVDALLGDGAVVCVENWMETSHREIRHELQAVNCSGNPNLGVVVVC